ncbi:hypothetical protein J6590_072360 [Homalodisca vitripennis]|nr:hypothetical protein J6590_072360 [Homalodisca vitripennis]
MDRFNHSDSVLTPGVQEKRGSGEPVHSHAIVSSCNVITAVTGQSCNSNFDIRVQLVTPLWIGSVTVTVFSPQKCSRNPVVVVQYTVMHWFFHPLPYPGFPNRKGDKLPVPELILDGHNILVARRPIKTQCRSRVRRKGTNPRVTQHRPQHRVVQPREGGQRANIVSPHEVDQPRHAKTPIGPPHVDIARRHSGGQVEHSPNQRPQESIQLPEGDQTIKMRSSAKARTGTLCSPKVNPKPELASSTNKKSMTMLKGNGERGSPCLTPR